MFYFLYFSLDLIKYCGESPDECCLVGAAKAMGFTLVERQKGLLILNINGQPQRWKLLRTIAFTNKRKRSLLGKTFLEMCSTH